MKTETFGGLNSFMSLPIEYADEDWWQSARAAYLEARLNTELELPEDLPSSCQDGRYTDKEREDGDFEWFYHEGVKDKSWMEQQDWEYLKRILTKDPERFIQEMRPDGKGPLKGLNLKLKHHQNLQKEFTKEYEQLLSERLKG